MRFVRAALEQSDIAHKIDHIECVSKLCRAIAREEKGGNLRILPASAYFHDLVSRKDTKDDFRRESAQGAKKFLRQIGFSGVEADRVAGTILAAAFEAEERGAGRPVTLETKILHDADYLEARGARGIARVFSYSGYYGCLELGRLEWNPRKPDKLPLTTGKTDPTPIYHFFSKLLHLRDRMLTKVGRRLANRRHEYPVRFLLRYDQEIMCRA